MKNKFLPKLILLSVLSMLIYSCTADDVVVPQKNTKAVMKTVDVDTITQPGVPNPRG